MSLDRFLTLLATIIGLIGSVFLVKGALGLSPDIMARLAETGWWFNQAQIGGLAAQKANTICGAAFVFLAFLLSMLRLAFVDERIPCFESKGMAFAVAIAVSAVLGVALLFVNRGIAAHQKKEIGAVIIGRRLDDLINGGKIAASAVSQLRLTTETLLIVDTSKWGDEEAFFKRLVEMLGRKLPDNFDFSPMRKGDTQFP